VKRTSILDEERGGRDQLELPEEGGKGGWDAVDWSDLAPNEVQCRTAVGEGDAFCNVVVKALCYKPEGRGFDTR
jgi:hypothetical protein